MNPDILLSRLLDKYEKSTHLLHPGSSTHRVMLRIGKKEFPEYNYEDAQIRDAWNDAVRALEARGLVSAEWVKGRPVLSAVVLNLNHVMDCYRAIGRIHPVQWAKSVADLARSQLGTVTTEWIAAWRDDVCTQAREAARVPSYCKKDLTQFRQLLTAFAAYDALHGEAITMRAFSGKCYQNTKTFELEVRDLFLKIASAYCPELAEACEHKALGERDRLAFLGIYARPELYELAGNCIIRTDFGNIDLASAGPYGLALPSTAVDCIRAADLHRIRTVILIENKTNYDAFLLTEREQHDLVLYHGGFLSPQKRKFFLKIAASVPSAVPVYLWADIDLGGFRMFDKLQQIFPGLMPMRMSADDVEAYHTHGLMRSANYLEQIRNALAAGRFPAFRAAMEKILAYGVTIEQEVFLTVPGAQQPRAL